ncbi:hypothetical protein CHLNCDRAFT_136728 [Chlorella variabilis]|uniref:Uncharacterized protein n=1 Tax=Chlorella variabilis TaxID=554065 RepID=E1ZKY2_CHLVA|nr:hypothetical protein CHLNCDRAFT_136728 [Chlorella variabilis]EFN53567.1 hypothetical protein CHLNCDRAFT_136728 [Chlorella variabilis]|eukprot:XP_005845669.1 hypothetical protein CHLNCDRAFT_136728 [Chlorella variabilis]
MTGLFLEEQRGSYLDDMEDRYREMLASSRAFVINQFGLSAFVWEDGAYRARTYNFHLFPRPSEGIDKRFVCQASSIDFLASCGFDFNKSIYDGIGYMPVALRDARLASVDRPPRERSEVLVRKAEDVAFVKDTVASVAEWLQGEDLELVLPAVNSYQRLLQYQELRRPQFGVADPPGFYRVAAEEGNGFQLRLTRAAPGEAEAWEAEQRQKRVEAIHTAAGFAAVMEAMRDSGKPAVGHNLAFDLSYSLHSYAQELPGSWAEYKQLVGRWFPGGVYDTKFLSTAATGFPLFCHLEEQVEAFLQEAALRSVAASGGSSDGEAAELPLVEHAAGFERYKGAATEAFAHEAGYDAYMTGAAFACLMRLYEADAAGAGVGGFLAPPAEQQPAVEAVRHLCWRMNISRSDMPYAALQGEDPIPDRSHIFYVHGWGEGQRVYGGELVRRLADSGLGQVRATLVEGGLGALVEVGDPEAVPGAADVLRQRYPGWTVAPYSEYADKRQQQRAEAAPGRRANGGNKRPRVDAEAAAAASKKAVASAARGGGDDGAEEGKWGRCTIM